MKCSCCIITKYILQFFGNGRDDKHEKEDRSKTIVYMMTTNPKILFDLTNLNFKPNLGRGDERISSRNATLLT